MAATLAIATAGGALLAAIGVPLAWMIGAMLATAVRGWTRPVAVPGWTRPAALLLLGLGLGSTFSGPVLAAVAGALPLLLAAGLLSMAAGLAVAPIFTRIAGTDRRTGFYCAVPGGVVVMAVLAQAARADVATVTLAQTLRLVLVVLVFPPLLGWLGGGVDGAFTTARPAVSWPGLAAMVAAAFAVAWPLGRTGFANPWMLGPCGVTILLAATGNLPSAVPIALIDAAQVGMGAALGVRLNRGFLLASRRLVVASIGSAAALSVLLGLFALPVAWAGGLPLAAAVLGMAPGGMPEMALTAKALDMAVPLVLGFHLTRTLLCNLLVAPFARLAERLGLLR